MKKKIIKTTFALVLSLITYTLHAQPPGGPGAPGGTAIPKDSSPSNPQVPFDGGMSLMLAASGISYAAKKLKDISNSQKVQSF